MRCCQSQKPLPLPRTGSQPSPTPKMMMSIRPIKKLGTDRPRMAKTLPKLSHQVFTFMADRMPSGTPRLTEMRKAAMPSLRELGRRWK